MAYFKCKGEVGKNPYHAYWDLKKLQNPEIDEINGYELTFKPNVWGWSYYTDTDLKTYANLSPGLTDNMTYLKIPELLTFKENDDYKKIKYILDVHKFSPTNNGYRAIVFTNNFGASNDSMIGFVYFQNEWALWNGSSSQVDSDVNFINDSVICLELSSNQDESYNLALYKNDVLIKKVIYWDIGTFENFNVLTIGSHRNGCTLLLNSLEIIAE